MAAKQSLHMHSTLGIFMSFMTFAAAIPAPSLPGGLPPNYQPVPDTVGDTSNPISDDKAWNVLFSSAVSDFVSIPFRHWALIMITTAPCLLLIGLTIHLHRQREAILLYHSHLDPPFIRIEDADDEEALDALMERERQKEMSELVKMGIDPQTVRMVEPGVYIEEEENGR